MDEERVVYNTEQCYIERLRQLEHENTQLRQLAKEQARIIINLYRQTRK